MARLRRKNESRRAEKKIAQIIADYFCPQGNEHKKLWGDDRLCYSKMNFAACEWVAECVDAIIAAGIGDTSDLEVRCEVLQRDVDNLTRTVEEGAEELKEAEHRAEVAERALREFAVQISCRNCPFLKRCDTVPDAMDDYQGCFDMYLKQSEKDLAEEKK